MMASPEESKQIKQTLLTVRIIWYALLMSQGLYLFLGSMMLKNSALAVEPSLFQSFSTPVGPFFFASALFLIWMSYILPKRIANSVAGAIRAQGNAITPTSLQARMGRKTTEAVLGFALIEAAGMLGFIMMIVFHNQADGTALIAIAAAVMITRFPQQAWIETDFPK